MNKVSFEDWKSFLIAVCIFAVCFFILTLKPTKIEVSQDRVPQNHAGYSRQSIQECANELRKETDCIVEANREICADGWTPRERLKVCAAFDREAARQTSETAYEDSWEGTLRGFASLIALVSGIAALVELGKLVKLYAKH